MEHIVVQVRDKDKAKILLELLSALDFVDSVQAGHTAEVDTTLLTSPIPTPAEAQDFFALAGLWQDRPISLESIRQQAWPRQYS